MEAVNILYVKLYPLGMTHSVTSSFGDKLELLEMQRLSPFTSSQSVQSIDL